MHVASVVVAVVVLTGLGIYRMCQIVRIKRLQMEQFRRAQARAEAEMDWRRQAHRKWQRLREAMDSR